MTALRARIVLLMSSAVVALGGACTDLGGLADGGLPDVPDAQEAEDAQETGSGPVDAQDAPAQKDAAEGSPVDARPSDAGIDANGPFCDSLMPKPLFCKDFDDGPLMFDWSGSSIQPGYGNIVLDTAFAQSKPNSALFTMNANPPACSYATLVRTFPNVRTTTMHLEIDLRLSSGGAFPEGFLFFLNQDFGGGASCALMLTATPTAGGIFEQPVLSNGTKLGQSHDFLRYPLADEWTHLVLDADYSARTLSARIGPGPDAGVVTTGTLHAACQGAGEPSIRMGVHCHERSNAMEFRFDNIVFDAK